MTPGTEGEVVMLDRSAHRNQALDVRGRGEMKMGARGTRAGLPRRELLHVGDARASRTHGGRFRPYPAWMTSYGLGALGGGFGRRHVSLSDVRR